AGEEGVVVVRPRRGRAAGQGAEHGQDAAHGSFPVCGTVVLPVYRRGAGGTVQLFPRGPGRTGPSGTGCARESAPAGGRAGCQVRPRPGVSHVGSAAASGGGNGIALVGDGGWPAPTEASGRAGDLWTRRVGTSSECGRRR